jgi:ATP-dependent Clp protease ATP-binding subunit ClpC
VFERFSTWGRQVVIGAQDEARDLRHAAIGPEHLLLGVLRDEHGLGGQVLRRMGLDAERVRAGLRPGDRAPVGQIPFTPRAKKILEQAMREALSLGHDGISSEHVVLGLAREGDIPGVDGAQVRDDLLRALDEGEGAPPAPPAPGAPHGRAGADPAAGAAEAIATAASGSTRLGSPWDTAVQAHLVLGVLASGGPVAQLLRERGVTEQSLREATGDGA